MFEEKQDDWDVNGALECRDIAGERDQACRSQEARLTNRAGDPTVWERDQVIGQLNFRQSKRGQFQQESGGTGGPILECVQCQCIK